MKKTNEPRGRYACQFDFNYSYAGKIMDNTENTQPDMTLTVRQLLLHHTRGSNSQVQEKEPLYFDIEVPNITDITDVVAYRQHLEEKIKYTEEFIRQEQNQAKEDALKEAKEEKALKAKTAKQRKINKQLDLEEQIAKEQIAPK